MYGVCGWLYIGQQYVHYLFCGGTLDQDKFECVSAVFLNLCEAQAW